MIFARLRMTSLLVAACAAIVVMVQPAKGETAKDTACQIRDALLVSRSKGIDAFKSAMRTADTTQLSALEGSLGALPQRFDQGKILEIARVDDLVAEYMIVMYSKDVSNIFFRVIFQKIQGAHALTFVHFTGKFRTSLAEWPIFASPKPVTC
ncbi:hypothetical protein TRM7615_00742 [Falsiruegeria mediterranea M17]|uniref:DUF3887 domain-containing protein n=1 Tax=Falsiruegeria mediterranea M17 TaxID=1200281 RepID=A0A2R8C4A6_9RHOB|nr:hypothetical protein TRM7615_00742 [Falsiruegeria mediterranea M17]